MEFMLTVGVKKNLNIYFILQLRSKKIKDFPNLYDNIFAGGQPSKLSIRKKS